MASGEHNMISKELDKLVYLIDIIVKRKLPENDPGSVSDTEPCRKPECQYDGFLCGFLNRQLDTSRKLVRHLEKPIDNLEEINFLLKKQENNVSKGNQNKRLKPTDVDNDWTDNVRQDSVNVNIYSGASSGKLNSNSDGFKLVSHRKPKSFNNARLNDTKEIIRGTNADNMMIQGVQEFSWIYVGRVLGDVSEETFKEFLNDNWPEQEFKCYELKTKGSNSSYKIDISMQQDIIINCTHPPFSRLKVDQNSQVYEGIKCFNKLCDLLDVNVCLSVFKRVVFGFLVLHAFYSLNEFFELEIDNVSL
ncbi:hypothetical protein HHI36_008327 [Cryptolaemus montrouzieri]|uniref:Uncharacterized protein n=1 Tax=Cryptolaemus montrouzieri TaxID=559131 RepID=A0ABD2MSP1_9CUCU